MSKKNWAWLLMVAVLLVLPLSFAQARYATPEALVLEQFDVLEDTPLSYPLLFEMVSAALELSGDAQEALVKAGVFEGLNIPQIDEQTPCHPPTCWRCWPMHSKLQTHGRLPSSSAPPTRPPRSGGR